MLVSYDHPLHPSPLLVVDATSGGDPLLLALCVLNSFHQIDILLETRSDDQKVRVTHLTAIQSMNRMCSDKTALTFSSWIGLTLTCSSSVTSAGASAVYGGQRIRQVG